MKIKITSIYVNDQEKALRFYDVQKEYDRTNALGAEYSMPPMKVTGSTIAMLNDTCGNLAQLVALEKWAG